MKNASAIKRCIEHESDHEIAMAARTELAELQQVGPDWLERCKKFRKQDAEKHAAELAELHSALADVQRVAKELRNTDVPRLTKRLTTQERENAELRSRIDELVREAAHDSISKGEYKMSFSVAYVGKPNAIKSKLAEHSKILTGQSKEEFDAVLPAMNTIDQNVNNGCVRLSASGHANVSHKPDTPEAPAHRVKEYGSCEVQVSVLGQIAE